MSINNSKWYEKDTHKGKRLLPPLNRSYLLQTYGEVSEGKDLESYLNAVCLDNQGMYGIDLSGMEILFTDMRFANLNNAKFDNCYIEACDFTGAYLVGASFRNTVFNEVTANGASFLNADFTGAQIGIDSFENANFEGAIF